MSSNDTYSGDFERLRQFVERPNYADQDRLPVYQKPKPGRSGDEARQGSGAI
jgi:hypothetical protein